MSNDYTVRLAVEDVQIPNELVDDWRDLWDPTDSRWPHEDEQAFIEARSRAFARKELHRVVANGDIEDIVSLDGVDGPVADDDADGAQADADDEEDETIECACGEPFESTRAFAGHKGHCDEYQAENGGADE